MKKIFLLVPLVCILTWSCRKDFVVEDISKKTLTINAPANNTATTLNIVTFWWDALDGAEQYNLQIVRPDFSKTVQLLLDTNVTRTKFNFSLKPGSYQWRIKATNAGHSTLYQIFNLKIDTTSDLSEQFVNLLSPVNGVVIGNTSVTFSWNSVTTAKKYQLRVNDGLVLDTVLLAKTSLTYTLPASKNSNTSYNWNVKAINEFSESQFNVTSYILTVDLKGPAIPVLTFPAVAASMNNVDSLKWKYNSDVKYDSVYVALDSLFINAPQQIRSDVNSIQVSEFQLPVSPMGTYYWWKIRSFDKYGNPSSYSYRQKFRIVP